MDTFASPETKAFGIAASADVRADHDALLRQHGAFTEVNDERLAEIARKGAADPLNRS